MIVNSILIQYQHTEVPLTQATHCMLTKTIYKTHQQVQVLRSNFLSATHYYVNLQKFVQLYAAVCTPMKQRKLVVDRIRVQHGLFHSSKERQS